MEKKFKSIGSQYPFTSDNIAFNSYSIKRVIENKNHITLNLESVVSILTNGYIYGNETLINGVSRKNWDIDLLPKDVIKGDSINLIALKLEKLLIEEIRNYIKGYKKIGILLSGGLDSRILAGMLKKIEEEENKNLDIIVYNWGISSSRDVIYAQRIAELYDWKYIHYELSSKQLKENFYNNIDIGCEISPLHLHAIENVALDDHAEIILAGTYGDSIGRGKFSGSTLQEINKNTHAYYEETGIVKTRVLKKFERSINEKRFEQLRVYRYKNIYELDQYANYLRRMLSTAMSLIEKRKPIFQIFTSFDVYNYMLSLEYNDRNDEVYREILKNLPMGIGDIPYAKTGKSFIRKNSIVEDDFLPYSHKYGEWLRGDLESFITENLDFNLLYKTGMFNSHSLELLYKSWLKSKTVSNNKLDEKISFLTNLCIFIKRYEISIKGIDYRDDWINNKIKYAKTLGYVYLRNRIKK